MEILEICGNAVAGHGNPTRKSSEEMLREIPLRNPGHPSYKEVLEEAEEMLREMPLRS